MLGHIQFLRAISVLSVFFYHLNFNLFKSGYLGVDIFFVISGYVISRKIYEDYKKKGKIDFATFYVHRFKRIFPLLFFFFLIFYFLLVFFFFFCFIVIFCIYHFFFLFFFFFRFLVSID